MIRENALKRKLAAKQPCVAAMLSLASPALAELLAMRGADAVILEAEHSTLNESEIENLTRAIELGGATPICRVGSADPALVLRVLDAGVMGVIIPHVRSPEDAARAVNAVKYPPVGQRGSAVVRASGYGLLARAGYVAMANAETMVIPMIEDPEAVEAIDAILAVPGVDCIFIGTGDLSLSMGVELSHPDLDAAVERVIAAARRAGIPFIAVASAAEAPGWIERGAGMISVNIMHLISQSWSAAIKAVHAKT